MQYSGNITILDEQGNTVFERELEYDEMVAILLRGYVDEEVEQEEEEIEEKPKQTRKRKTVQCSLCGLEGHTKRKCHVPQQTPEAQEECKKVDRETYEKAQNLFKTMQDQSFVAKQMGLSSCQVDEIVKTSYYALYVDM